MSDPIDEARTAERATPRTSYRGDWWWTIVDGTTGEQVDGGGDDFRLGAPDLPRATLD